MADDQEKIMYLTDYPDEDWVRVSFYMEPNMIESIKLLARKVSQAEGAAARTLILGGMMQFMELLDRKEDDEARNRTKRGEF